VLQSLAYPCDEGEGFHAPNLLRESLRNESDCPPLCVCDGEEGNDAASNLELADAKLKDPADNGAGDESGDANRVSTGRPLGLAMPVAVGESGGGELLSLPPRIHSSISFIFSFLLLILESRAAVNSSSLND